MCLPVFIALRNMSSVQTPMPVWRSGVRLAANVVPHGPANAVLVAAPTMTHGPGGSCGAGGSFMSWGWPERKRVMSGWGPVGPILNGVWHSLQPAIATRYLPRSEGVEIFSSLIAWRAAARCFSDWLWQARVMRRTATSADVHIQRNDRERILELLPVR